MPMTFAACFLICGRDDIVGGVSARPMDSSIPIARWSDLWPAPFEHGATLWKNAEVTGIRRDAGGIAEVETTRGARQHASSSELCGSMGG